MILKIKILWKVDNENIIRYFDHFELRISNWSTICIITEYCEVRFTNNQTIKIENDNYIKSVKEW